MMRCCKASIRKWVYFAGQLLSSEAYLQSDQMIERQQQRRKRHYHYQCHKQPRFLYKPIKYQS